MEERKYRCGNCRQDLYEGKYSKVPLDFKRNEEGKLEPDFTRFSIFCKTCETLVALVDPIADTMRKTIEDRA